MLICLKNKEILNLISSCNLIGKGSDCAFSALNSRLLRPNPSWHHYLLQEFNKIGPSYTSVTTLAVHFKPRHTTHANLYCTSHIYLLFVCLSTKAVHLEAFQAFQLMIFSCTKPIHCSTRNFLDMYSDNGTSFIGAQNQLKEVFHFLKINSPLFSQLLA